MKDSKSLFHKIWGCLKLEAWTMLSVIKNKNARSMNYISLACVLIKHETNLSIVSLYCHRTLTIGQMQGKFQMVVVRHTGHAIQVHFNFLKMPIDLNLDCTSEYLFVLWTLQEDVPDEFVSLMLNFISHNRIGPNGIEVSLWNLLLDYFEVSSIIF